MHHVVVLGGQLLFGPVEPLIDGGDVRVIDPSGHTSHFIWRDARHILAWTRPEAWHLTLMFLGDWPPARLPDLGGALRAAVAGCRHGRPHVIGDGDAGDLVVEELGVAGGVQRQIVAAEGELGADQLSSFDAAGEGVGTHGVLLHRG